MKEHYVHDTCRAIHAVFNPDLVRPKRFKLPDDFFVDPAPWSLEKWGETMNEYKRRACARSATGAPDTLMQLIQHVVGLPKESRATCLDEILAATSYVGRASLDQFLRIAHQILQVAPDRQAGLLYRLKVIAAHTLTTRVFGAASYAALTDALGLDKPGPWFDKIQKFRPASPTASPTVSPTVSPTASPTVSATATPTVSATATPTTTANNAQVAMRAPRRKHVAQISVDSVYGSVLSLQCSNSKRPRKDIGISVGFGVGLPAAPIALNASLATAEVDCSMDMETIDAMIAEIDSGMAAEWARDFERYDSGCGSYAESAEILTRLLQTMESLAPADRPRLVEKLFDRMNDGKPVEFAHAYQLWLQLNEIRQTNPNLDIAPQFGRAVSQWALTAHWTPEDWSAASVMLNS